MVEQDRVAALRTAEGCGTTVMEGNATRNAALGAARLASARALIVSADRDDTSILIVPTARRIAPDEGIADAWQTAIASGNMVFAPPLPRRIPVRLPSHNVYVADDGRVVFSRTEPFAWNDPIAEQRGFARLSAKRAEAKGSISVLKPLRGRALQNPATIRDTASRGISTDWRHRR